MKAPTIETVAKTAGVSVGTVSRYLNGFKVREYNRIAIESAIEMLQFKVNQQARGLKLDKSFTIALVFPNISDVFATQVIEGVEAVCDQYNYSIVICSSRDDIQVERNRITYINEKRVDGAIVMPISDESLQALQSISKEIPYVVIDKIVTGLTADYVVCENREGSIKGVEALIQAGHTEIAVIGGPEDVYTARERLAGYHDAMKAHGLPIHDAYITRGEYRKNGGLASIHDLMTCIPPPTAVFATNFEITMSVIKYCMSHGIRIGHDVSILGYDNIDVFEMLTPSIAAVAQPMKAIGEQAAIRLFERLQNKEGGHRIEILPTNVVDGSSIFNLNRGGGKNEKD